MQNIGNKKQQNQNGYSTWDPRKAKNGEVPQYDEIPYGDVGPQGVGPQSVGPPGHSGKGQLPQVPAEYSQVPNIPQRQGTLSYTPTPIAITSVGVEEIKTVSLFTRGQKNRQRLIFSRGGFSKEMVTNFRLKEALTNVSELESP